MAEDKTTLEPAWLWYFLSFVIPVVGIILGLRYRRRAAPESREFGKKTIIAAVLGVIACLGFYLVWFIILGAAEVL